MYAYIYICIERERNILYLEGRQGGALAVGGWKQSAVNRGQREHTGSFRGCPKQGGGAVFSWLLSLAVLALCVISTLKLPGRTSRWSSFILLIMCYVMLWCSIMNAWLLILIWTLLSSCNYDCYYYYHIYIYIHTCGERERDRDIHTYIHIYIYTYTHIYI